MPCVEEAHQERRPAFSRAELEKIVHGAADLRDRRERQSTPNQRRGMYGRIRFLVHR
jgi:hypothetical protein